jgi:transposase-like protein
MPKTRKSYTPEFKTQVVLEVLSNTWTVSEIGSKYSVHPVMIGTWKKEFLEKSKDIFKDPRKKSDDLREKEISLDEAHKTIGQLTVERDWLKKKYAQLGGIWP